MGGYAYEVRSHTARGPARYARAYDPPKSTDSVVTVPPCLPGAAWFSQ